MRINEAEKGTGMTEGEAKEYLIGSRSNMILGTVDSPGNPSMQPVWYYFDPQSLKLYMFTARKSAKAANIGRNNVVYFYVDDDKFPYKGVRGRGHAKEVIDEATALRFLERILARYIKPGHPANAMYTNSVRGGKSVVFEISPTHFTTWDTAKIGPEALKSYSEAVIP